MSNCRRWRLALAESDSRIVEKPKWRRLAAPIILGALALLLLYQVRSILPPFVIAFLIALLFEPFLRRAEQRGWPRPAAVAVVFFLFVLLAVCVLVYVVPVAVKQATDLAAQVNSIVQAVTMPPQRATYLVSGPAPFSTSTVTVTVFAEPQLTGVSGFAARWARDLRDFIAGAPPNGQKRFIIPEFLREPLRRQLGEIGRVLPRAISKATSYVLDSLSSLLWLLVVPLVTLYVMLDLPKISRWVLRLVPPLKQEEAKDVALEVAGVFANYVRGVCTVAVMNGTAVWILLWALGIPKPLVLGMLAGVLYPVPYIGALTSLTVACLVALFSHGIVKMLWVLLGMVLLNQVVFDQIVLPRILGGAVGLHPLISIFAMMAAGSMFGIVGVILAVPAAASIAAVLKHMYPRFFDIEEHEKADDKAGARAG
ncbi:MAG: AI-2E family transporter [Armatimonadota bacterium]